jgi:hypothetical protein
MAARYGAVIATPYGPRKCCQASIDRGEGRKPLVARFGGIPLKRQRGYRQLRGGPGPARDGLVRRTVYPEVPVRVEYALTEAGRTLREPLRALEEWSIAHLGDVSASQEAYDRAHAT